MNAVQSGPCPCRKVVEVEGKWVPYTLSSSQVVCVVLDLPGGEDVASSSRPGTRLSPPPGQRWSFLKGQASPWGGRALIPSLRAAPVGAGTLRSQAETRPADAALPVGWPCPSSSCQGAGSSCERVWLGPPAGGMGSILPTFYGLRKRPPDGKGTPQAARAGAG